MPAMSPVAPFLFDHEFANTGDTRPAAGRRPARQFSADDLAAARAEGVREGIDEGIRQAAAAAQQRTAEALAAIAAELADLNADLADHRQRTAHDTLRAALAMVRALFPALHAKTAATEITALAQEIAAERGPDAKLTVRVAPAVAETIEARLTAHPRAGADPALSVVADDALTGGDCRIDWPGGGAVREAEEVWRRIESALAAVLDAAATDAGEHRIKQS